MSWKVYGTVLETADINGSSKNVYLKFRPNSNQVVKLFSTWFVFYNSPVFTALSLKLYDDQNGLPGKLIATSTNSFAPSDLYSLPYAIKGVGFTFNDIALLGTSFYHLIPYATGYTGTDATHIAWAKGWPDNEYRTGLNLDYEEIHTSPYRLAPIAARF